MKKLVRYLKGSFWYAVVLAIGILYAQVPLDGQWRLLGFVLLALVIWPAISWVRSKVKF